MFSSSERPTQDQIDTLEEESNTLEDTISSPDSGLEAQLAQAEDDKLSGLFWHLEATGQPLWRAHIGHHISTSHLFFFL